jgi:probable rRNA maturation factor
MPVTILKRIRKDSGLKTASLKVSRLEKRVAYILDAAGAPGAAELSVALIDDVEMRQLNLDYRGIDKPTDVLAFSQTEGEFGDVAPEILGDVVVSLDTASRQAKEAGHDLLQELDLLIIHGVLHLLGYDHEKSAGEERKMREMEKKVLSALNQFGDC